MTNSEETIRKEIQLLTDGKGGTNYCIKAGAGAGKTTLLSKRISRQLVKDPVVPIDKFVVITYTNTAASELHSKISEELYDVIKNGTEDEQKKAKAALSQLDLMQISTIHSFLFNILREHSFESGVGMDVQMLEDDEEINRRNNFFNDWCAKHSAKIESNRMCEGDWTVWTKEMKDSDKERDVYLDTFNTLANIRDNIVCDEPLPADDVVKSLEATARSLYNDLITLRENDKNNRPHAYYELTEKANERFEKITTIEVLKDTNPLSAEQIDSILSAYKETIKSNKNKIYEKISNNKISTFKLPDIKDDDYNEIENALKQYNKAAVPDPNLLSVVEPKAKELLQDLIDLKNNATKKENRDYKEYELNSNPEKLLKLIDKYIDIESKASFDVYDILRILALYKFFLGFTTQFYKNLKNTDIKDFKYPDSRTTDYENLKNTLDYQRGLRVVKLVLEMRKDYQNTIDSETLHISNDDILYRSKVLLEKHPDILEKLRTKFSKIYIDEFQDTTPVQTEIMKMLASKPGTPAGVFDPEDDKLFVVGDPKQSIYRFTGADKSLFENLYGEFENNPAIKANGQAVELNINYRSNSDIVSWVNETFDSPDFCSNMKDDDWVVTDPHALHGVFQYLPGDKYTKADDVNAVVDLVTGLVGKPYCLLKEEKDKTTRMIKYSDITIIFKKTKNIDNYLKAFTKRSIPVSMQGKYKLDEDEILKNFVILLDFFANSKNKTKKYAAAQVLTGVDLIKYDTESARNKLDDIRFNTFLKNKMDAAAIVQYLLSNEDLFLPKKDVFETWEVNQYKIRLHQMTESCLANNDGDLKALVDSMYKYLDTKVEHEIILEKGDNAVKFINVHKVKGMSEQIVIIADRSQSEDEASFEGFRGSDGNYYPSATYQNYYNREYFPTFMLNQPVAEEAEKKVKEDLMCLQYVAATRARNALIIMPELNDSCWFKFSKKDDVAAPGEEDEQPVAGKILPSITKWLEDQKAAYQTPAQDPDASEAGSPSAVNKKTLEDLEKLKGADLKLDNSQLVSITPSSLEKGPQTGYTKNESGYILEDDRPGNNIFGTVMHRTFELIVERRDDITSSNKVEQAECAINQAIIESYDDIEDADRGYYHNYLNKVLNGQGYIDNILSLVEGADEVYTEFDFSFFVPDEDRATFTAGFKTYLDNAKITIPDDKTPIWINGQADLVVRKGDQITVYDYKSDKRNGKPIPDFEDALIKKYEGQLALYRYAVGKAFGHANVKADKDTLIHLYK